MPHRIYTTSGFVIESRPYGEAGKMLSIFTRELGMVNAAAAGIRLGQSKLRYHVQDFSLAEFSLVRGRDIWRLVGAEKAEKIAQKNTADMPNYHHDPLFIRTLAVLRRLIHGEEKNEALFEAVIAAYDFLNTYRTEKAAEVTRVTLAEPVIMLRILHHLGYIRKKPELEVFLADNSFAAKLLEKMSISAVKSLAIREINKALEESHL
jgi:DNA repair protein RecO